MSLPALDNLVRIGQLKAEPRNVTEVTRMLEMARTRLADAQLSRLSLEGRFTSAYTVALAAALAALRWHGYRSANRYTVFQCLAHTVIWPANRWRVFDAALGGRPAQFRLVDIGFAALVALTDRAGNRAVQPQLLLFVEIALARLYLALLHPP